jgi:hypothetical protein
VVQAMIEPWDRLRLNFSVTSSDVAGRLYQSFLASTPALQREGRLFPVAVAIDRQRERGAFYTPQPIAELLAERCLGEVLDRDAPATPSQIRVLDPACGSGAFLLAAYRILEQYFAKLRGRPLSEEERLQILTDSLFGGDDDETAVALSRIQLLEEASVDKSRLPYLGGNIATTDLLGLDRETVPAGWARVIEEGGFHVLLSNPPFHGPTGARQAGFDTADLRARFSAAKGTGWNIAGVFLEAGLTLLSEGGHLTMLLPQSMLEGPAGVGLRETVGHGRVVEVIDFGRNELFAPTMAYVAAVGVRARSNDSPARLMRVTSTRIGASDLVDAIQVSDGSGGPDPGLPSPTFTVLASPQSLSTADSWSPFVVRWQALAKESVGTALRWIGEEGTPQVFIGTQTGADRRFVLGRDRWTIDNDRVVVDERYPVPRSLAPWWIPGGRIRPFDAGPFDERVIVPCVGEDPGVDALIEHLGGVPRSFFPGKLSALRGAKVVVRGLFDEPASAADTAGEWMIPQGGAGAFAVVPRWKKDVALVEALLNSALYQWLLQGLGHSKSGGYAQLMLHHWRFIPWPILEREQQAEVVAAGREVRTALRLRGAERVSQYWDARLRLDEGVYASLKVTSRLQDLVTDELWRGP